MTRQKNQKKDVKQEESPAKKEKPEKKSSKKDKADNKEIIELKEQISSEKDRVLRLSAEFENFQKRKQRELDEFKKFANETIFKQLLPVVDNLERAIDSTKVNSDQKALLKGVELTHKEIVKLLETFSVKPVEAEDKIFDPNFHQAVTQEESDQVPANSVTKVLQKGYLLHDRLIRPAMVIVSKKKQNSNKDKKEDKEN